MALTLTLSRIRPFSPCRFGWKALLQHLGTDFPEDREFSLLEVLNSKGNSVQDAIWCLRATKENHTAEIVKKFVDSVAYLNSCHSKRAYAYADAVDAAAYAAAAAAYAAAAAAAADAYKKERAKQAYILYTYCVSQPD